MPKPPCGQPPNLRLAGPHLAASEKALEIWRRINALPAIYVKDLRVRDRANLWMLIRRADVFRAQVHSRMAAKDGRLQ
jgi:hypothetical protein